jgi:hypothetical protein
MHGPLQTSFVVYAIATCIDYTERSRGAYGMDKHSRMKQKRFQVAFRESIKFHFFPDIAITLLSFFKKGCTSPSCPVHASETAVITVVTAAQSGHEVPTHEIVPSVNYSFYICSR